MRWYTNGLVVASVCRAEASETSSSITTASQKGLLANQRVVNLFDDITSHKVCVTRHRAASGGLVAPSSVNLPQLLEVRRFHFVVA